MADPSPKMDFPKEFAKGLTVHSRLEQEVIVTTTDKLRLLLIQYQNILLGRTSWIAPFSILVAITTTLVAADFKDMWLSKEWWRQIFTIGVGVFGLWLVVSSFHTGRIIWNGWRRGRKGTIEDIV